MLQPYKLNDLRVKGSLCPFRLFYLNGHKMNGNGLVLLYFSSCYCELLFKMPSLVSLHVGGKRIILFRGLTLCYETAKVMTSVAPMGDQRRVRLWHVNLLQGIRLYSQEGGLP